jgi:hypothetical protein
VRLENNRHSPQFVQLQRLLTTLLVLLFAACHLPAQSGQKSLSPSELVANASAHLNHPVHVEILESLYGA